MTKHKVRISKGNVKLGFIPSVSLPAVVTCPKGVPCIKGCYVVRNMYGGPWGKNIRKSHDANLKYLQVDAGAFFGDLGAWIDKKKPKLFRFHVSGDFISDVHFTLALELAASKPETGFLAFTKRHDLLIPYQHVPKNFSIVASRWPGWTKPRRGYRSAWMEPAQPVKGYSVPSSALRCPGNCETCGMCWELRRIKRDVVFAQH